MSRFKVVYNKKKEKENELLEKREVSLYKLTVRKYLSHLSQLSPITYRFTINNISIYVNMLNIDILLNYIIERMGK